MSIGFNFNEQGVKLSSSGSNPRPRKKFRIVILGDFSGRKNRGECTPASISARPFYLVDPDTLEELPRKLGASLLLPVSADGSSKIVLKFENLEAFHPDQLYDRVELFSDLRRLRRQLDNPQTFQKAARELMPSARPAESETATQEASAPPPANLLEAAIGATETGSSEMPQSEGEVLVAAVIREAVAPYVIPAPDPRQAELIASVDASTGGVMRTLLHHPDFQILESNWRGLEFLLRRIETSTNLSIEIVDVSKEELLDDLRSTDESNANSQLRELLKHSAENTSGIDVIAACFPFGPSEVELPALEQLAGIGASLHAPVLTGAHPAFLGCYDFERFVSSDDWYESEISSTDERWSRFRRSPNAEFLGLLTPRVLSRLPYGQKSDVIEKFAFDEFSGEPIHAQLLWGSPCIPAVAVLAQLQAEGQPLSIAGEATSEFDSMPFFVFESDGEKQIYPVAERELGERAAKRMTSVGLTPVLSVRGRDAIQIPGLRSVSDPPAPLAFD